MWVAVAMGFGGFVVAKRAYAPLTVVDKLPIDGFCIEF
jgi:hypothetical protein